MKTFLIRFWPILFIFAFWLIFSSPFFFAHKVPFSSTYQVTFFPPWSAYPHNGVPVKNAAMPDVIDQIVPWRHLAMSIWQKGEVPLWNPYSFAGTPLLANYQSAVLSPFNVLFLIFSFPIAWGVLVLLQPLLAGLFAYLFTRSVKISPVGSLISSLSFMFCGFIVSWMGYATLGYALLFLPLGMYAIEQYFKYSLVRYLVLLSFVLPLSFLSGHFQISLYVLAALVCYGLYKAWSERAWKKLVEVYLFMLFGMLLCLPQILPSLEFYTQSLRSDLYQRTEVIPWAYLPTLLAPDFFGNPVTRNDWFGHYAEWNGFVGTVGFLLAIYGVRLWRKTIVPFLVIGGLLSLLLALPTPLGDLLVTLHVPVLSTSAASRIISLYCFFFAVLAGFGWDSLVESVKGKKIRSLAMWMGASLLLFAMLWIVVIGKLFMPVDKLLIAKQNLMLPTLLLVGLIFAVGMTLVIPKKWKGVVLSLIVISLVSLDMYRFATKWQSFDPSTLMFETTPVTQEFQKISGYQRAVGLYGAQVSNFYQIPSLEGYDALYPKKYGEFISYVNDGKKGELQRSVVSLSVNGTYTPSAINLLNVRYVIHKKSDDNMPWTLPYWNYPKGQFVALFEDSAYRILKNTKAYPHAFLVGGYSLQPTEQKALSTLFEKGFDMRKQVVLDKKPSLQIANDPHASSVITFYSANSVTVKTKSQTNMLLFLSDSYYPGWNAYVDGKKTPILRADYAFRAVSVAKNTHTVVFSYQPMSFWLGVLGAGIGLLGILGVGIILRRKK